MQKHSKEKIEIVKELHKPIRKKFPRRRTIIKGLNDLWQADLADLNVYARDNKNHKYILVVIDCFSKFMWARPLKSKSAQDVTSAFADILRQQQPPKNIQTDRGTEFFNKQFQQLMKKHGINHYSTFSTTKASIAERVIRTLKENLYKYFSLNGSYKWLNVLPNIVKNYNERKHSVIKMRPIDVTKDKEKHLLKTIFNHAKIVTGKREFKVGDFVRISKAKHVFDKSYTPNWTTEIFKIAKVQITNPVTYLLEDMQGDNIKGSFYKQELQRSKYPDIYLVEKGQ